MAQQDLSIRFTEDKYATKAEVAKDLKMTLIDSIWSKILAYRINFNHYLTLRSIENSQLTFCLCPSIANNVNSLSYSLLKVVKEYTNLSLGISDSKLTKTNSLLRCLQFVAKDYGLEVSNQYLRSIISGDMREIDPNNAILKNYLSALLYIEDAHINSIDEDFLANVYSKLLGTSELTSFYRTEDVKKPENRVLIDRVYSSAPARLIETMISSLFDFIKNSSLNSISKALIAYYYFNYIKPFPEHNDAMAILLMKAIFCHYDVGNYGAIMPLESLLIDNGEEFAKVCLEVQKTGDVTYFVVYGYKTINRILENTMNDLTTNTVDVLKKDFYKEDEEKVSVNEVKEETIKETQDVVETRTVVVSETTIAVNYIPKAIDEKEAARLEIHLRELDPSLKKGEAKFYARHCTLGKKYTIQQYKKCIGCAYETARTSMEHLAELGYYRKEMIKNKFVYTPIPRD